MSNQHGDAVKKTYALLPAPLFLSGCMMLGMGGMAMHGAPQGSSMNGQTLVKESVANGMRLTAEFPPYALGDALVYEVTLRDVRDKSTISDASIALIVMSDENRNQGSRSGQASSQSGHGDSSTTRSQGSIGKMKVSPDEVDDGRYVFRPSITNGGAYKFVFVLDRVGSVAIDPPIEVEQNVQLDGRMDKHAGESDHATRSAMAPVVVASAAVMAIMMVFMLR
jgi:hypothetical protein